MRVRRGRPEINGFQNRCPLYQVDRQEGFGLGPTFCRGGAEKIRSTSGSSYIEYQGWNRP